MSGLLYACPTPPCAGHDYCTTTAAVSLHVIVSYYVGTRVIAKRGAAESTPRVRTATVVAAVAAVVRVVALTLTHPLHNLAACSQDGLR